MQIQRDATVLHRQIALVLLEHRRLHGFAHRQRRGQRAAGGGAHRFVQTHHHVTAAILGGLHRLDDDVRRIDGEE